MASPSELIRAPRRKTPCPEPTVYDITFPAKFDGSEYPNLSDLELSISLEFINCIQSRKVISCRRICDVIMPSILHYLSKANHIACSNINTNQDGHSAMYGLFLKIQQQIRDADENLKLLKHWEKDLDDLIKDLIIRDWDWEGNFRGTAAKNAGEAELYKELREIDSILAKIRQEIQPPCPAKEQAGNDHDLDQLSITNVSDNVKESLDQVIQFNEIEDRYLRLDSNLQNCLLYFSAFPPNSKIRKKALVYLWIGEGFINSEDIAEEYFKELVNRGFVVPVEEKETGDFSSCKTKPSVHNWIVELAKRFNFFHFDSNRNPTIDFVASHRACLSRTEEGANERLVQLVDDADSDREKRNKLHSLINLNETFPDFPKGWFAKVNNVHTLFLGSWESGNNSPFLVENSEFLQDLCKLKILRCLSLNKIFKIKKLPPSIAKLFNLKILDLKQCYDLREIPNSIGSLNNLTHLDISECHLIDDMPKGLSKLEKLIVLKGFVISGDPNSQIHQCTLADLVKLKNLRKLSIYTNRNVTGNEGKLNSLSQFQALQILKISWTRAPPRAPSSAPSPTLSLGMARKILSFKSTSRENVENTNPGSLPASLQKLDLRAWPLPTFPRWVDPAKLQHLNKLYIKGGSLSDMNQWMFQKSVKILRLQYLKKLKMNWQIVIHQKFPGLVYLNKIDCPVLESFPADGVWRLQDGEWKRVDNTD